MSKFVSDKTRKISLGDDEFIEVKESIAYDEFMTIVEFLDRENEAKNAKMAVPLIELVAIDWNLKDDEGKEVPFSKEAIKKLNVETILGLLPELIKMYLPEKKI